MTSDSNPPEMPGTPEEGSAMENAMADAKAAFENAGFSTPQGMVALGGLILIVGWLIFDFFMNEFGPYDIALVMAIVAVLHFFGMASILEKFASKAAVMRALGYGIAIFGLLDLIWVLRYASSYNQAGEIIGAIVIIGGALVTYLGARAIKV